MAKRRLRNQIPELTEALTGRLNDHHAFLTGVHLDLLDRHTAAIDDITATIEQVVELFQALRELICTIPGISTGVADVICAEIGADLSRFPTAAQLALLGRHVSGQQRVPPAGSNPPRPPGQPLPQGRTRRRGVVGRQHQGHLPGGQVTAASAHAADR